MKILKRITHNWHIKLISGILALILWLYVENLKEIEYSLSVPIETRNIPADYIISNEIPISVNVVLKGKESRLSLIDENVIMAYVDLKNDTGSGKRSIVRIDKNSFPQRISIKEIKPMVIDISIEKILEKQVKIIPVIIEEPPDGYIYQEVIVNPEQVQIQGPESMINGIDSIYTEDINIGSLKETTVKEAGVNLPGTKISLVNDETVSVKIVIKEIFVLKRIYGVPVVPINVGEDFNAIIEDATALVLLKIPKRIEGRISREKLNLYVDCMDVDEPGTFTLPIHFETDIIDVSLIKIEPWSVDVTVEIIPESLQDKNRDLSGIVKKD